MKDPTIITILLHAILLIKFYMDHAYLVLYCIYASQGNILLVELYLVNTNLFPPDMVGQLSSVQTSAIAPYIKLMRLKKSTTALNTE